MASLEWYIFSGCCDNTTFQVQSLTPPADFQIGNYYYLLTDQYTGCTSLISTGYSPSVHVISLQSYSPQVFTNCTDCITYYPCGIFPTLTPTTTPPPTPGFGVTPTNTITKTQTITRTQTRTSTQTPNLPTQTQFSTPTPTKTPTLTKTQTPSNFQTYWLSACCPSQGVTFGITNAPFVFVVGTIYYSIIPGVFTGCTEVV